MPQPNCPKTDQEGAGLALTAVCKKVGTAGFRSKQINLNPRLGLCPSNTVEDMAKHTVVRNVI